LSHGKDKFPNMKKTGIFLLFAFFSITQTAIAQRYGTAVGLRLGNNEFGRTIGISAQQRVMDRISLEGILQSDFNSNTTLSLLLEKHNPIISKRFNYYYGAGVSFGSESSTYKDEVKKELVQTYGNGTVGVDLIGGVELTIVNTVISLDYKPNVNISGRNEFYRGQVGISARMVLVKSKEQKKKKRQRQRKKGKKSGSSFDQKIDSIFKKKN
jgi:hypothetical protein